MTTKLRAFCIASFSYIICTYIYAQYGFLADHNCIEHMIQEIACIWSVDKTYYMAYI